MMQSMDELSPVFQAYMLNVVLRTASAMRVELMRAIITREKERLTEALGHEPDEENWEDYWQLLREQTLKRKACQREADRKKLRRLIMGNTDAA